MMCSSCSVKLLWALASVLSATGLRRLPRRSFPVLCCSAPPALPCLRAAPAFAPAPLVTGEQVLRGPGQLAVGPTSRRGLLPWAGALLMWREERFEGKRERTEGRGQKPLDFGLWILDFSQKPPAPRLFLSTLLLC